MPEFIAVRCVDTQCGTYQCIQKPKPTGRKCPTRKFKCRICSKQQSILKTFAISEQPADIRRVVQTLNANRAEQELNAEQSTLRRLRERPVESNNDYSDEEDLYQHQTNKRQRYHDSASDSEAEHVLQSRRQYSTTLPAEESRIAENAFNPFDVSDEEDIGLHSESAFDPPIARSHHESLNVRDNDQISYGNAGSQSQSESALTTRSHLPASSHSSHDGQLAIVDEAELDDLLNSAESMF